MLHRLLFLLPLVGIAFVPLFIQAFPTSWLIQPQAMWVDGGQVHFQRTVTFPVTLQWRDQVIPAGSQTLISCGEGWSDYSPSEAGPQLGEPWVLRCMNKLQPGTYRIIATWRARVGPWTTAPTTFVSDPFTVE